MSKAQYDIYVRKVIDLASTLVIKSQTTANSINTGLAERGLFVNDQDPASWKYYLHLSGRYHSTDTMMSVTSLDTLQRIDFTRENLQVHRTTYREYAYGSRFYAELVSQYPDQEMLVLGILNPIDIQTAIGAREGQILYHDASLVEDNETNLIAQLSLWSEGYMARWHIAPYALVDDLYPAVQLSTMYANLPMAIMNIRLANCHTRFAHSFHIREFLASHGQLDAYVDHLTKKQMLWLYRNIRYIHRNIGQTVIFDWLIENLLSERGLPLAEWSMRHNIRDQVDEIYPDIEFGRTQLNLNISSAGADINSVQTLLNKEQPLAKGNARIQEDAEILITRRMENSLSNRLNTKVLESSVLDKTDATVYTRSDCLLNHWLYLGSIDRYNAIIVVEDPTTGDRFTFHPKDAFVVFLYAYNKARGYTMDEIPLLQAKFVRRIPKPTVAKLRALARRYLVSDELLQAAWDAAIPIGDYISTISFYEDMVRVHEGQLYHRNLYVSQHHMRGRVETENAVTHLYADIACDLGQGTTYTEWFEEKGLEIPTFNALECDLLANSILRRATGVDLTSTLNLREMQGAMLRLMAQLSSYSVQYIQSINTQPIQVIEWPAVRVGDDYVKGKDHTQLNVVETRLLDIGAHGKHFLSANENPLGPEIQTYQHARGSGRLNLNLTHRLRDHDSIHVRVPLRRVRILSHTDRNENVNTDVTDHDTNSYVPINRLGLEGAFQNLGSPHYVLTNPERATLLQRWTQWSAIHNVLMRTRLDGLEYPVSSEPIHLVSTGLDYPIAVVPPDETVYLDGLGYPNTTELDGLEYPINPERLDGLVYPTSGNSTQT